MTLRDQQVRDLPMSLTIEPEEHIELPVDAVQIIAVKVLRGNRNRYEVIPMVTKGILEDHGARPGIALGKTPLRLLLLITDGEAQRRTFELDDAIEEIGIIINGIKGLNRLKRWHNKNLHKNRYGVKCSQTGGFPDIGNTWKSPYHPDRDYFLIAHQGGENE